MDRQWLYNKDGGILFESEEAIAQAIKDGYVDTPTKVKDYEYDNTNKTETPVGAKKRGKVK